VYKTNVLMRFNGTPGYVRILFYDMLSSAIAYK